jgi:hypothetical protein
MWETMLRQLVHSLTPCEEPTFGRSPIFPHAIIWMLMEIRPEGGRRNNNPPLSRSSEGEWSVAPSEETLSRTTFSSLLPSLLLLDFLYYFYFTATAIRKTKC